MIHSYVNPKDIILNDTLQMQLCGMQSYLLEVDLEIREELVKLPGEGVVHACHASAHEVLLVRPQQLEAPLGSPVLDSVVFDNGVLDHLHALQK